MAVVGSSGLQEAAELMLQACAGPEVTWRSPGSQEGAGNKLWFLESGGGGRGFVDFLDKNVSF